VSFTADAAFTEVETCDWENSPESAAVYTCSIVPVVNSNEKDKDGAYVYRFSPTVNYPVVYTVPKTGSLTWIAPYDGTVNIAGAFSRTNATGAFFARILKPNNLLWKQSVPAGGSSSFGDPENFPYNVQPLTVSKGDQFFFEIQSEDPVDNAVSWSPDVHYTQYCGPHPTTGQNGCWPETCTTDGSGNQTCSLLGMESIFYAPVQYYYDDPNQGQEPFGGGFRQWYYGEWNGNNAWDQSKIIVSTSDDVSTDAVDSFSRMIPLPGGTPFSAGLPAWSSGEDRSFITASSESSSRIADGMGGACTVDGVLRQSTGTNQNLSGSFGIGGSNRSHGNTDTQIELIDMNGDGYPDLVTPSRVELNDGKTGLKGTGVAPGTFRTNYNDNTGYNLSVGATVNAISSVAKTLMTGAASSGKKGGYSIWDFLAMSIGYVRGRQSTKQDLIDVNGDGLPDLVYQGDPKALALENVPYICVRLNLGNRFGEEEHWYLPGDSKIKDSATRTLSINLVVNYEYLFGVGVSRGLALNVQKNERDMVDINGDGLPDMVYKNSDHDYITVRINQGGSFGEEEHWPIPSWRISPPQRRGNLQLWSFFINRTA
jgi:hypothetical protein